MFENISDRLKERAQKIKLIALDCDGVLTDGSLYISEGGEDFKKFNCLDGHGLRLAVSFGIKVAIISARNSPVLHKRYAGFGFEDDIHIGVEEKFACLEKLLEKYSIKLDEVAYIGDDALDVPVLEKVGLAVCPPNAHFSVKKHIHYITDLAGGSGAAREFVDLILCSQGKIPNN